MEPKVGVELTVCVSVEFRTPDVLGRTQNGGTEVTGTSTKRLFSRTYAKDNISMWGQLYIDLPSGKPGGWLVDSWSEFGPPHWNCRLLWYSGGKFYQVMLNIGFGGHGDMHIAGEEAEVEPD